MNKDILKQIGLTDYETDVYLALLTHGQMSAYELAEKAGLYRQVTYDTLKRLAEKGFVSSVMERKTKLFKAIDPEMILEFLNEKTENYKQILPELIKINKASKQPLSVETYKGKNVVRIWSEDGFSYNKFGERKLSNEELVVAQILRDNKISPRTGYRWFNLSKAPEGTLELVRNSEISMHQVEKLCMGIKQKKDPKLEKLGKEIINDIIKVVEAM